MGRGGFGGGFEPSGIILLVTVFEPAGRGGRGGRSGGAGRSGGFEPSDIILLVAAFWPSCIILLESSGIVLIGPLFWSEPIAEGVESDA